MKKSFIMLSLLAAQFALADTNTPAAQGTISYAYVRTSTTATNSSNAGVVGTYCVTSMDGTNWQATGNAANIVVSGTATQISVTTTPCTNTDSAYLIPLTVVLVPKQ